MQYEEAANGEVDPDGLLTHTGTANTERGGGGISDKTIHWSPGLALQQFMLTP